MTVSKDAQARLCLRVSPAERAAFVRYASERGLSVSALVRLACEQSPVHAMARAVRKGHFSREERNRIAAIAGMMRIAAEGLNAQMRGFHLRQRGYAGYFAVEDLARFVASLNECIDRADAMLGALPSAPLPGRSLVISIEVSSAQRDRIDRAQEVFGMAPSAYCRRVLLEMAGRPEAGFDDEERELLKTVEGQLRGALGNAKQFMEHDGVAFLMRRGGARAQGILDALRILTATGEPLRSHLLKTLGRKPQRRSGQALPQGRLEAGGDGTSAKAGGHRSSSARGAGAR